MISADGGNLDDTATLRDLTRRMKHLKYLRWWTIFGGQSTILYLAFTWAKGGSPSSSNNKDGINDNSGGWCCHCVWLQTSPWSMKIGKYRETPTWSRWQWEVHLSRYNRMDALASSRDHFNDSIPWKSDQWRMQALLLTWVIIRPNLTRFQVHKGQVILSSQQENMRWRWYDMNAYWYLNKFCWQLFYSFFLFSWHCPVHELLWA